MIKLITETSFTNVWHFPLLLQNIAHIFFEELHSVSSEWVRYHQLTHVQHSLISCMQGNNITQFTLSVSLNIPFLSTWIDEYLLTYTSQSIRHSRFFDAESYSELFSGLPSFPAFVNFPLFPSQISLRRITIISINCDLKIRHVFHKLRK